MDKKFNKLDRWQVVTPSICKRYSGINASMAAVVPEQLKHIPIVAVGFHIPPQIPRISFFQFLKNSRKNSWFIWHCRRNTDMLAGIVLRYIFRFKLILLFTSAAQREHSWITRWYYKKMKEIIATSNAAASYLDKECTVITHGVNIEKFAPPENRSESWSKRGFSTKYGIGILGRVRPNKGTEEFVDAMIQTLPKRPDWTAVIIGQVTQEFQKFKKRLRTKIEQAGLSERIHFTGFLKDASEIPKWYRSLSVVVCGSHVEGFGLPCLEAMASGCPVVATQTGAWPQVVADGEDGFLIPCKDGEAMAQAIMKITEDPKIVYEMGRKARKKMEESYKIEDEARRINEVYQRLLDKYS